VSHAKVQLTSARPTSARPALARSTSARPISTGADLSAAYLTGANLDRCDFAGTKFAETILSDVDLRSCIGLDSIEHQGPSPIDIRTLQRSGPLPLAFLRGIGLPEKMIEYLPSC
jgi:uncharacterized protein YjbI with pentapeptide repeats